MLVFCLALLYAADLITVTEPTESTIWTTGQKAAIKWDYESSDAEQTSVVITLYEGDIKFAKMTTLVTDNARVDSSKKQYSYDYEIPQELAADNYVLVIERKNKIVGYSKRFKIVKPDSQSETGQANATSANTTAPTNSTQNNTTNSDLKKNSASTLKTIELFAILFVLLH